MSTQELGRKLGLKAPINSLREFVHSQCSGKTEYEVNEMVNAIEISKKVFEQILPSLEVGDTPVKIGRELNKNLIGKGGVSSSFDIDVRVR